MEQTIRMWSEIHTIILISILNDPSMTCSGVQLIGTFNTRRPGQGASGNITKELACRGFSSSYGDWISSKMGNLLTRKNESFEMENYNARTLAWDEGVSQYFPVAHFTFSYLIYYFHFNEHCTSTVSMGRVFGWLRWWWCCVCLKKFGEIENGQILFFSLFEYDKHEPCDEINHMQYACYTLANWPQ